MNKVLDPKEKVSTAPVQGRKHLVRHILTYGLGTAADAFAALLVTPILAHNLAPRDYGILELLNRTAAVVCGLLGTGLSQAYNRYYLDRDDSRSRGAVVTLTFGTSLILLTLMIVMVSLFSSVISRCLLGSEKYSFAVILAALSILATLMFRLGTTHLWAVLCSHLYVTYSSINGFGLIFMSWLAISVWKMGLTGALVAPLVVSLVLASALVASVWFKHEHVWDMRLAKDMLRFALPFLPSAVFAWALHNIDRYFINEWCSPTAVGIYSLGYKVGFSVSMVSEPVMRLWVPYALSAVRTPGRQHRLGQYISYVFAAVCSAALAISLFASEIVSLVSSPEYNGAAVVVPVVAAAYAIWGVCSMSDIGIIVSKRTGYKPLIFFLACIVNVLGNVIFVPRYGIIAAAWTTLAGMIVFYIAQACITRKVYPIGLKPSSMLVTFAVGVIAYVEGAGCGVIGRVLILVAYMIVVGVFMLACRMRWQRAV